MIFVLALRTLFAHPVRTAVLAAGFGIGVAVMAILLGVAEVVLDQAREPALVGGGDVIVTSAGSGLTAARVLLTSTLRAEQMADRIVVASPWVRETLYLISSTPNVQLPTPNTLAVPVRARGGVPSLERALGDREIADQPAWHDAPPDRAWSHPDAADVLRVIDRFHAVPDVPARAASWAEWLYFNGRAERARFYLTFLVGPRHEGLPRATSRGGRAAGVRLQLERDGRTESFGETATMADADVANAPDLRIGGNRVTLEGLRYRIALDLPGPRGRRARGEIVVDADPGRLLPPIEIHGAGGWRSGYVVPVMSGVLSGFIEVDGERIPLDGVGYHDHNWGFWEGVSWQWGQVQHGDTSVVFGRVFPPGDAADPDRIPGFLVALGPDGPLGFATNITIAEESDATGRIEEMIVQGRSGSIDVTLTFRVTDIEVNRMAGPLPGRLDFVQMRGEYHVTGKAGDRSLEFRAVGSAETFRGSQR